MDPSLDPERPGTARPFWQWILIAIAPGLYCDAQAVVAKVIDSNGVLAFSLLFAPLAILAYLIVMSGPYTRARGTGSFGERVGFVLGFGLVNAFLWLGSCSIVLTGMSFH